MKKRVDKPGFALVLLVFFIGIIGIETIVLSGISSTMAFETNQAYLQACRGNLIISGLAWAKENADRVQASDVTELDVTSLSLRRAELRVAIGSKQTGPSEANIVASCSAARQTLRTDGTYEF